MHNLSMTQALTLYGELVDAYHGRHNYGGHVVEINGYRLMPRISDKIKLDDKVFMERSKQALKSLDGLVKCKAEERMNTAQDKNKEGKKVKCQYKGCRRTPDDLFKALEEFFGKFDLDLFADDEEGGHKCERHFTKEQDAFMQFWKCKNGFGNPPFSPVKFVENALTKARLEVDAGRADRIVIILPLGMMTAKWWEFVITGKKTRAKRLLPLKPEFCNIYILLERAAFEPHPLSEAMKKIERGEKESGANGGIIALEFERGPVKPVQWLVWK